ncbi:MAG: AMP-binding protein [Rhodothermales bacterium]|nr:AMP-binding protein [Rhodothermales bacterium]
MASAQHHHPNLPPVNPEQSLTERFRLVTAIHGARLAISDGSRRVSYQELDRESDRLAWMIRQRSGLSKQPVGLICPQSAESIISILAVLKSGNVYVSLDPSATPQRTSAILQAIDCRLILTDGRHLRLANDIAGAVTHVLNIEDVNPDSDPIDIPHPSAGDVAYIFFTSGTTGEPKGVFDSHTNAAHNVLRYSDTLHFGPDDRMSLVQAPSFSGTVSTIFGALLNGASLFPYDAAKRGLLSISSWLRSNEITIYHSVPALFRVVFEDPDVSPALRLVRLEGDRATTADLRLFERTNSSAKIVNGLGSTETGLVSQFFAERGFENKNGVLPVGSPVRDMSVSITDETGSPVDDGESGYVAVTSPYLALGYQQGGKVLQSGFRRNEDGSRTYVSQDLGVIREHGLEILGRAGRRRRDADPPQRRAVLHVRAAGPGVLAGRPVYGADR